MSHDHDDHEGAGGQSHGGRAHGKDASTTRLLIALALNVGITVAQVVGGVISGSLSLLADAAHNGSDAASLGISYAARKVAERPADRRRTFGYERAELIGAFINLVTLFIISLYLTYSAIQRFLNPQEVEGMTMLIVGGIAFVEDAISVWLLSKDLKSGQNVRAVFIHLAGDTLATLGVMVGAVLIMAYGITWVDPLITLLIAVYISVHAYVEIRKTIAILMESAPEDFPMDEMTQGIEDMEHVRDVHHVHVWRLDEEQTALEAHVAVEDIEELAALDALKGRIKQKLEGEYGIGHATLELEHEACTDRRDQEEREGGRSALSEHP